MNKTLENIIWCLFGLISIIWSGYMLGSELNIFPFPQEMMLFFPIFPIGMGCVFLYIGLQQKFPLQKLSEVVK